MIGTSAGRKSTTVPTALDCHRNYFGPYFDSSNLSQSCLADGILVPDNENFRVILVRFLRYSTCSALHNGKGETLSIDMSVHKVRVRTVYEQK